MLKAWGPYTAHLGIMLILIGYCLSYGLGSEDTITLEEGGRTLIGNFILELDEIKMEPSKNEIELIAAIKLKDKDSEKIVIEDELIKKIQSESNQDETVPYLKHELHRDLYLTLNTAEPGENGNESSATITVREIPGIILVWIGSFLTIIGMLITMFTEWKTGKGWLKNMSKKVKVDDFKQLMRDMFGDRYIDAGGINDPIMHNNKKILTESLNKKPKNDR